MPADISRQAPLILAFDTSAAQCAAALVRGDAVLAQACEPMARGQAERLLPLLEELLAKGGVAWRDLDALAVCTGPGNFTGLRIAVAAARGLALGLDIPAVGISRFEALAAGQPGAVEVALPDSRGGVFVQRFEDGVANGPPVEAVEGLATDPGMLAPAELARLAAARLGAALPPVAPLYLRRADAAPSSEPPTRILDDA